LNKSSAFFDKKSTETLGKTLAFLLSGIFFCLFQTDYMMVRVYLIVTGLVVLAPLLVPALLLYALAELASFATNAFILRTL